MNKEFRKLLIPSFIFLISLFSAPSVLAASLKLTPNTGTVNPGCTFSVDVMLDTGSGIQTDGTDVILNYDPTKLTVSSITNETLYSTYPLSSADPSNNRINISGLASVQTPVTTNGFQKFATINFSVPSSVSPGPANVAFYFTTAGDTTDSNVVQRGTIQDVLAPPLGDGNYTVGSGSCASQTLATVNSKQVGDTLATPSAQATPSAIPLKTLPKAGSTDTTVKLTLAGVFLTLLGVAGLAIL